ncbi:enoyl-CoA hydratase/isomerase family protein [Agreia pratensis]|uniref:enoyl-CoA hydratase/isomerase family protein n=1 Tax=Agreia pratensis TaxID=150121 RepID=UPI00188B8042|nr:enoyl-CoA hydratase/isomerase family protein [Agreia pratensis]MBF4636049.1 enoyl-CoA hydratase/isomerase family protein [Agreia pratensis]
MSDVLLEVRGRLAHITLNRPRAINALTHEMVTAIGDALTTWALDDSITTILLTGNGTRGLCAGGDVTQLHGRVAADDVASAVAFLRDEYLVNNMIARYPKPFVAIMNGFVLGGGIGLSGHASHRVVTNDSALGMPEVSIGLTPDVGGSWLLSHAPRELGTYLALTARTASASDAIELGLADSFVPSNRIASLVASLEELPADEAVAAVSAEPPRGAGASGASISDATWIEPAFAHDSVEEILDALAASGVSAATETAALIRTKSPTAVAVTLESLRRARELPSLEACLNQELRIMAHALAHPDFREGVRAQVIDKDRTPRWAPATLEQVSPATAASFFEATDGVAAPFPTAR